MISKEDIENLGELVKLKFSQEEAEGLTQDIIEIVKFIEKIEEVDTIGVEPMVQVSEIPNPLRDDKVEESLTQEEALKNTLEKQYGYLKLLRIMD